MNCQRELCLHGDTYSGHPKAFSVVLKNIEIIKRENLVGNSRLIGIEMLNGFKEPQGKHQVVGNVRAIGLIGGKRIFKDKQTGEGYETLITSRLVNEAAKRGLISRSVTFNQDTLVFALPLIINKAEIGGMLEILDDATSAVEQDILSRLNGQ